MSSSIPTQQEARRRIELEKRGTADIVWKMERGAWHMKIRVSAVDEDAVFTVVGCVGKTNHSFALLDANNIPLAKFTKHAPHRVAGVLFEDPHKHIWDGETENSSLTYVPDDINPNDDYDDQLLAFCKECNITLHGKHQRCTFLRPKRKHK